ncbi:hypothetical protein H072_10765 [Dactylellina haptotyla CBS 200.50]|uniref:ADF-H domain-containing protein n=1 Tax=Dactylellina haptotyla (strain CBS 200.50) TaxID=1284197 RepID=S8BKR4_DACHA|nr:hypothetical protein H072_10765 [Dactylellina haptotyla CBS 200.50]
MNRPSLNIRIPSSCLETTKIFERPSTEYIIYQINAENELHASKVGHSFSLDAFLSDLPKDQCRYALRKISYMNPDTGTPMHKNVFYSWSPGGATETSQELYSEARERVLLGDVFKEYFEETVEAHDYDLIRDNDLLNRHREWSP